jgi:hypothetical protein
MSSPAFAYDCLEHIRAVSAMLRASFSDHPPGVSCRSIADTALMCSRQLSSDRPPKTFVQLADK